MGAFFYFFPFLGVALEGLLLWRLSRWQMWRHYPLFATYVLYDLLRTLTLFAVTRYHWEWYATVYWRTEVIALLLRFLVVWEVFRQIFPARSPLYRLVSKGSLFVQLALLPSFIALSGNLTTFRLYKSLYPVLEQGLSLVQAILVAVPLLAAKYYGVSLGRNVWGLAIGFGMYVSVCALNFATFQLKASFVPYWRFLVPATFVGMVAMWTWAFWIYAPNAVAASLDRAVAVEWLERWERAWTQAMSSLRKVMRP